VHDLLLAVDTEKHARHARHFPQAARDAFARMRRCSSSGKNRQRHQPKLAAL